MNYHEKYLKYKKKYLELKQIGGYNFNLYDVVIIIDVLLNDTNPFNNNKLDEEGLYGIITDIKFTKDKKPYYVVLLIHNDPSKLKKDEYYPISLFPVGPSDLKELSKIIKSENFNNNPEVLEIKPKILDYIKIQKNIIILNKIRLHSYPRIVSKCYSDDLIIENTAFNNKKKKN